MFILHVFPLQGPEMLSYQPSSESCLIGCYNTEEPKNFHRQQVIVLMVLCTLFIQLFTDQGIALTRG